MWFKNLQLFRLRQGSTMNAEALAGQLARGTYARPAGHEAVSRGWVAPRADGGLIYSNAGQQLIRLVVGKRLLPSSVVNAEVKVRAEKLTEEQGYAPGRKQLRELKERVTEELMPKSHIQEYSTWVWIDPKNGWLIVDAGSPAKAVEVIEHLRFCLDEFPLELLHTMLSPQSAMTDWLASGDAPDGFTIARDVELKALGEEKSVVSFKRHPLGDEWAAEVKTHLTAGKLPTKLALTWDDRISFVLTEKLEIKRLAFLDLLKEEAEKNSEHTGEQFDADFALMTGELMRFLPQLVEALGGEKAV